MQKPPAELDGARVLCYIVMGENHHRTGAVAHHIDGVLMGVVSALAVAQYEGDTSVYLFHCTADWQVIQDDLLGSLEEATQEIRRQYSGVEDNDIRAV